MSMTIPMKYAPYRVTADSERKPAVLEALSYEGTEYHRHGFLKGPQPGVGVDCATFIYCVFRTVGLFEAEDIKFFADDWWAHTSEEEYVRRLARHAKKMLQEISYRTLEAKPGNIVTTHHDKQATRAFNHGGIVIEWPWIIHALVPKVAITSALDHEMWNYREVIVWDPFEKAREKRC